MSSRERYLAGRNSQPDSFAKSHARRNREAAVLDCKIQALCIASGDSGVDLPTIRSDRKE